MSKEKKILTSVYLTPETKKSFNEICDDKGLIGTRVIEKLIEEWIKENKKKVKKMKMYELIVTSLENDEVVFSEKFSSRDDAEDKLDEFNSDYSATINDVEMVYDKDSGDWLYSGETSINEDNAIDVKTFLFGGEYGGPYNTRPYEGWHCLGQEFDFDDTKENFEDFYANVEGTIDSYCWDTENCITVEIEEKDDMCQVFEMPSRVKVKRWYDEQKERYMR